MSTTATLTLMLILSGGDSPTINNYSQYLQAQRVATHFTKRNDVELTILFGSGITPQNQKQMPPDVMRKEGFHGDGLFVQGVIPNNQGATYAVVKNYFHDKLANHQWQSNQRVFLFVDDHGMPNEWDPSDIKLNHKNEIVETHDNNCINLWHPEVSAYPEHACLSVNELGQSLLTQIPKEVPIYYVMSQCFSGGFHELSYHLDESGVPKKIGNSCGFTAITKDESASGCTQFVSEALYDGYERRIAEAITGISVTTGKKIAEPKYELLKAHQETLLKDNTKDVPLRTSEAYLLELLHAKLVDPKESEKYPIPTIAQALNPLWLKLSSDGQSYVSSLNKLQSQDLQQRLTLIKQLKQQLMTWHPTYSALLDDVDLFKITERRQSLDKLTQDLIKQYEDLQKDVTDKLRPIEAAYIIYLKQNDTPQNQQALQDIQLAKYSNKILYSRFLAEDKTLKNYQDFLNRQMQYKQQLLVWAMMNKVSEQETLLKLQRRLETLDITDKEITHVALLAGQFRRLETQMMVAAGNIWLHNQKDMRAHQADFEALIACEHSAVV